MKDCRTCLAPFAPSAHQEAKRDFLCPACAKAYAAQWRAKRKAAGLPVSGSKTWDKDKRAAWLTAYYARSDVRARRAEQMRRYTADPVLRTRHMARWLTRRAIETGRLVRQPCEVCANPKTDAHHDDYLQPLAVRWLCRKCHREHHAKAKGGA